MIGGIIQELLHVIEINSLMKQQLKQ